MNHVRKNRLLPYLGISVILPLLFLRHGYIRTAKGGAMTLFCGRLWFLQPRPLSDCWFTFCAVRKSKQSVRPADNGFQERQNIVKNAEHISKRRIKILW